MPLTEAAAGRDADGLGNFGPPSSHIRVMSDSAITHSLAKMDSRGCFLLPCAGNKGYSVYAVRDREGEGCVGDEQTRTELMSNLRCARSNTTNYNFPCRSGSPVQGVANPPLLGRQRIHRDRELYIWNRGFRSSWLSHRDGSLGVNCVDQPMGDSGSFFVFSFLPHEFVISDRIVFGETNTRKTTVPGSIICTSRSPRQYIPLSRFYSAGRVTYDLGHYHFVVMCRNDIKRHHVYFRVPTVTVDLVDERFEVHHKISCLGMATQSRSRRES